jgi:transposase
LLRLAGMTSSTVAGRTEWGEGRRLRAWELKQQGWSQRVIARALGVTEGAVSQWCKRAREQGAAALRRRIAPGPAPKLPSERLAQLPAFLALGAEAFGFRGEVWTTPRVAVVIERVFGVRYHPAHVSRLLRAVGWSPQKPVRRATQRDEAAIEHWLTERWPALQKGPSATGARSPGSTSPASTSCPPSCGPTPRLAAHRSCAPR